ncbi:MAG: hypothetical protein ACTSYC_03395 [Promethearchaeota archaeon]
MKDQILSMLIEHSRIFYSVISNMGVYYSAWAEGKESNAKNMEKKKNKLYLSEEDADAIKIKFIQDFSEAGTQGLGNYIALILRMDNTINYPLEFIDILNKIPVSDLVNDEIKKQYRNLINKILEMADVLRATIKALRDNRSEVFKNTTKIHEIENTVDGIFREFLDYLYDKKELDIGLLLRIRDSIIILEELADNIHDIADFIRILIYQ